MAYEPTKIGLEVYALVDGDHISIMVQPDGHDPVCLLKYPGRLPEKAGLIGMSIDHSGHDDGHTFIGVAIDFRGSSEA